FIYLALIVVFACLYVNVPNGFNTAHGLHPPSVELFRALWPYPSLTLSASSFSSIATAVVAMFWLVYLLAIFATREGDSQAQIVRIFTIATILDLSFAWIFPTVLSSDVYHYALFGRMFALHGMNPYVTPGSAAADDPFWYLSVWHGITTQYGPTWTLI